MYFSSRPGSKVASGQQAEQQSSDGSAGRAPRFAQRLVGLSPRQAQRDCADVIGSRTDSAI
eukprot:11012040-Alexandrium_andersonii.AAC.1